MSSASRAPTTTTLPMVTTGGRVPILSWATPLEGSALEQARNLANLPFAIDHVALMPDAHTGYGMPIGGVLFADRAVVPYAIGVDIGCGVALVETDLTVDQLDRATLDRLLGEIASRVPTWGFPTKRQPPRLPQRSVLGPEPTTDVGSSPGMVSLRSPPT